MKWIRVDQFGQYKYKSSYSNDEQWKTVLLCNVTTTESDVTLPMRSCVKSPVKAAKISDINKQLKFIPSCYRQYYEGVLCAAPSNEEEEAEESSNDDDLNSDTESHNLVAINKKGKPNQLHRMNTSTADKDIVQHGKRQCRGRVTKGDNSRQVRKGSEGKVSNSPEYGVATIPCSTRRATKRQVSTLKVHQIRKRRRKTDKEKASP